MRSDRFGDRLARAVAGRESQLVLGLDPDPVRLWPAAVADPGNGSVAERAGEAVAAHCRLVLAATAEHCVGVKLQVACFERLGAPGWTALAGVIAEAQGLGLLVICDGKRGDIDVSARAYAQAYFGSTPTPFGPVPGLGADALTVNPLLGLDSLAPLAEIGRAAGSGLFVLVRTSNPGAGDIQDLVLSAGQTVSDRLAGLVRTLGGEPGGSGLSDIGAVTGATAPQHLERLREAMPTSPFLLPGVGAQGGRVQDLAAAFAPGPGGGLVSSSRGIVFASETAGGEPARAAAGEAARLRELAWQVSH
ncbi:MAG: orotidine-5-phosphate decarboxylase [Solirubrobacteraceae bacterium]|nr:orotidine-5-phosphate decarboxylase [Solirubrobacteraceae bacterium]